MVPCMATMATKIDATCPVACGLEAICIVNASTIKAIAGDGPMIAIVGNLMVVEAPAQDGACLHMVPQAGQKTHQIKE